MDLTQLNDFMQASSDVSFQLKLNFFHFISFSSMSRTLLLSKEY